MEDNLNGRQPQWKKNSTEDDLCGIWPQWKATSMEDELNGRWPQFLFHIIRLIWILKVAEALTHDCSWSSMEDNLNGRQPQWKTISMEQAFKETHHTGRRAYRKMTLAFVASLASQSCSELGPAQPQLVFLFDNAFWGPWYLDDIPQC